MIQRTLLAAGLAAGLGALALGPSVSAGQAQVSIDSFTFLPTPITVPVGTRVTWTNRDDIPHTVIGSDDPRTLRSPPLDTNDSYSYSFLKPGKYGFFCSLHPQMQGAVVVE